MTLQTLIQLPIFLTFMGLLGVTIANRSSRSRLAARSLEDWLLDSSGLIIQGVLIPLLQATVIFQLYQVLLPVRQGCFYLSPLLSFLLSFVVVDYLYYWNHRLLHRLPFWQVHRVHHTVTHLDVLGTSRNTLWASFLIIYLWIHTLFVYLLANPTFYLIGVSLTCALDLGRHSGLAIAPNHWFYRLLSPWLILPQDHARHHGSQSFNCNFGANLKLWDKLHGTYAEYPDSQPSGVPTRLSLVQKLLFPFP
jgi:sterol desaturase/sphingolipid hydroxylase (fatty acid hydroxylase superfamily)